MVKNSRQPPYSKGYLRCWENIGMSINRNGSIDGMVFGEPFSVGSHTITRLLMSFGIAKGDWLDGSYNALNFLRGLPEHTVLAGRMHAIGEGNDFVAALLKQKSPQRD